MTSKRVRITNSSGCKNRERFFENPDESISYDDGSRVVSVTRRDVKSPQAFSRIPTSPRSHVASKRGNPDESTISFGGPTSPPSHIKSKIKLINHMMKAGHLCPVRLEACWRTLVCGETSPVKGSTRYAMSECQIKARFGFTEGGVGESFREHMFTARLRKWSQGNME